MFWSAISSSSNFHSDDFVNRFISSISFRKFWNKTKLCVHSSPGCFTGHLGVGGWADGISEMLKLFRKNNDSGRFWVSGKTEVSDSEKGGHWFVRSARVSTTNSRFFVWFSKNRQPVLRGLCLTCFAINLANVLLNTRFHR